MAREPSGMKGGPAQAAQRRRAIVTAVVLFAIAAGIYLTVILKSLPPG